MIEKGATLEEMKARFEGMDLSAYLVLKAIANGTISAGLDRDPIRTNPEKLITNAMMRRERNEKIFRMFDEGAKIREVQERFGLNRGAVEHVRGSWAKARGLAKRKKGA